MQTHYHYSEDGLISRQDLTAVINLQIQARVFAMMRLANQGSYVRCDYRKNQTDETELESCVATRFGM